ncbi:HK97 family phage prohead protease [Bradyrhizobium elkanii]|uniref:HK97 family phage prohead protease n=1 Tax=Bradyrhizobium elkanii TaxID=29448 RepID=UPI0021689C64|nr:HK97 family phage prohead protease [Bradyrhizobium elkanii]MCS3690939.1 HK97 family phage prohead protease [Bradyrhizobium elkanii]
MELTRKLLDSSALTLSDQRLVKVICSTSDPDRTGDVIIQNGIDLTAYRKNPVVLWGHSADVPIARATEINVVDGKLQATVQFPAEGEDEDSDWVYNKIKAGIINATSVGFIPKEYEPVDPKSPWSGYRFDKSELLEFSFVSVPANSGCLIVGRSLFNGVDLPRLPSMAKGAQDGVSTLSANDDGNDVKVPRNVLEEAFRLAKTPRAIRQKYLAKSATPDWKVGAARDLPIDEADAWDGAAAAKRMLDAAGFDGDSPDEAKAARGFLIHDSANPGLRGSYKLPFADIIGGELKAVKAGISAAKGRLDQTDAPASVLDEAQAVIDGYEKREGEGASKGVITPVVKSGRSVSAANEDLLRKAMDHHESATKCIKQVLDSNTSADDPDGDGDNDSGETMPDVDVVVIQPKAVDPRAERLAEAKAFKEQLKSLK